MEAAGEAIKHHLHCDLEDFTHRSCNEKSSPGKDCNRNSNSHSVGIIILYTAANLVLKRKISS